MIASFGCFAFFLLVIALLIALLFYKQRRKNNESHYSGIFLGPDGKQTLYVGEEGEIYPFSFRMDGQF